MFFLDLVNASMKNDSTPVDHRKVVGHPLDLVQQMGREEGCPSIVGHRANDGVQDVPPYHGVQPS